MPKTTVMILVLSAAACGDDTPSNQPDAPVVPDAPVMTQDACAKLSLVPTQLRTDLAWFGSNRTDLTGFLDSAGCKSPTFDPSHRPIALWDWDNTIGKNDFGDAMTFWFIANAKVLQPPNQDWHQTSEFLSDAAATALTTACGTTVAAGDPLPTNTNTDCADEMLSIYNNETTRAGAPAFNPTANLRRMEPAFAWTPQLMAGYTHDQIQQFTQQGIGDQLAAAQDSTQTIGTTTGLNAWLRIYDQQKDLIAAAKSRGYDVWIITASPQDVIGAMSPMVGVPYDHVIGIRSMTDAAGKLTYKFEGCGDVPDGVAQVIPTIQGKRCYVNKVVFGETTKAWQRRPDGQRWVFAAGDSDSDVEFVRDATYKLAINRNKGDLMCHAYNNENDSWRVNPMFIEPKAAKPDAYTCSTTFADEHGVAGSSRDEGGNVIGDQADAAHP